jgi:hypothetical protein
MSATTQQRESTAALLHRVASTAAGVAVVVTAEALRTLTLVMKALLVSVPPTQVALIV